MEENQNQTEIICSMCHRPESQTGKMFTVPGNLHICPDCMQKSFNMMMGSNIDWSKLAGYQLTGNPWMMNPQNQTQHSEHSSVAGSEQEDAVFLKDKTEIAKPDDEKEQDEKEAAKTENDNPETEQDEEDGYEPLPFGNVFSIPLGQMDFEGLPIRRRRKKKKKEKKELFKLSEIQAPHTIKEKLDEYVIGQEQAKKVISVAVYNHYKRVFSKTSPDGDKYGADVEIEKSNILMIGPTGSGKTYLVKTLAKLLDVPLAIADATALTEAGYIGDDIESVLSKLLSAANGDVDRAEMGIVFIDEIDKLAKKRSTNARDINGEAVQQELLKLLEGADVEVPIGTGQKNAMSPSEMINTDNILFICGGAFPDLEDIIKERISRNTTIGFGVNKENQEKKSSEILSLVTNKDLREFGMIPEFLGRLPVMVTLEDLTENFLVRILKEPKNAILKQYEKLLAMDEVKLKFDDDALEWIAKEALKKDTGARALRAIIEEFMLDIMFEIPKDPNIGAVTITRAYLEKRGGPGIEMRTGSGE